MSTHSNEIRNTPSQKNQRPAEREAVSAKHHPVDDFKISPRLYSGDDHEFGRIANPDATIIIDAAGRRAPQRVSWSGGDNPAEVYVAAFIPARRWNGWAKPYFSQDECVRLAATQSAFNDSLKFEYDPEREVWQEFNNDEGYREDCPWMILGNETVHQIGSGFTWVELPDEPTPPAAGMPNVAVAVEKVRSAADVVKRRSVCTAAGVQESGLAIPGSVDAGHGPCL